MRLILRHGARLHTLAVSSLIPSLQAKIDLQQGSRLLFFERVFEQLHYQHTLQQKINEQMARRLRTICLMDPKPVQKITQMFFAEAQEFNQEFLTQAWVALSKAHLISYIDNENTLDLAGRRLLYTAQFRNMTEEIKYGLKKRKISFWNMISIMEGCVDMGYVDYEIFSLLMDETMRVISRKPDLQSGRTYREFQLEKKNYHDEMELPVQSSILHSEQFREALKIVRDKVKEKEAMNSTKGVPFAELIEEVQQTGKNFQKLAEGIISARRGYRKMVKISSQEYIERRPAINLELLELEEYLLSSKMINMHDIKHPQLLSNEKYEAERCQQVLLSILNIDSLEPYKYLVQPISIPPEIPDLSEDIHRQIAILRVLADMALVDNRVYCVEDGRSLISIEWEKTLVKDSTADDKARQDLRVSRVFRRVFREVMPLFQTNQILMDRFKNRPLQERIELYVPFLKMGSYQQVIKNMEVEVQQPLNLSDFNDVQFMSLIYVLNNVSDYIDMSSWSDPILEALSKNMYQESIGLKQLPLAHVIDCLNLMIKLGQVSDSVENSVENSVQNSVKILYQQYLNLIEQQAAEFNGINVKSSLAVEAYKILALSTPKKHLRSSIYLDYIQQINSDQSLFNPYMEVFRETYLKAYMKGAKTVGREFPFLKIGFDSSTGQERAILIMSSDDTSLDGVFVSGNQRAFVMRLEQVYNVVIQAVPVNLFVTPKGKKQFIVAEEGLIRNFFDGLFERKGKSIKPALENLERFGHLLSASPQGASLASKWKIQLSDLKKLLKFNSDTQNIEQTLSVEARIITLLLEFVKDTEMLHQSSKYKAKVKTILFQSIKQIQQNIKTIQANISALRKQAQSKASKDPLTFKVTKLTEVSAEELEASPVQASENDNVPVKPLQLGGRRLSLQTLKPSQRGNDFVELIDNLYYQDKTYVEYSDWGAQIKKVYELDHFEYRNLAPLNKILVRKYLGRLVNCISLLPFEGRTEKITKINVSLRNTLEEKNKFKTIYPDKDAELKRRTAATLQASVVLRPKIIIQNLKHELKLTTKPEEILDYMFSSSYVQKLLKEPQAKSQGIFIERDVNEYFNHLERRHDRAEIISPNIEYVLRKLENVTEVKCLLQERQIIRQKNRELFKVGAIRKQQYYASIAQIEKKIIASMEKIKSKALDHMEHNVLDGGLRMVSIEVKDINLIKDWFANFKTYDRAVDIDYVFGKENAMSNKRARAQSDFIKFYILHKICKEQPLSKPCIQFLSKWHADVNNLERHKIETKHTHMKFKDLSMQEQLLFQTSSFKLKEFSNLYLIDFILEMSQFFDYKFLAEVQDKMKAEKLTVYGIPADLLKSSRNNQLLLNTYEQERAMLNYHSKLTLKDKQQLIEMVSVFKTEAYLKRRRFETVFQQFEQALFQMNLYDERNEFIIEYIRALDEEFFTDYNSELLHQFKQQGALSRWMDVFGMSPEQISSEQIKSGVGKLCLRIAVMGNNPPPFFGGLILKILQQPKTDILVKQHIIATLEKYKVPLRLDTLAIDQLMPYEGTMHLQVLREEANLIANKQIVERVAACLKSLLPKKELKKATNSDHI